MSTTSGLDTSAGGATDAGQPGARLRWERPLLRRIDLKDAESSTFVGTFDGVKAS